MLIKQNNKFFFIVALIFCFICSPEINAAIPNRNTKWQNNSCWINVGVQALTACTEFVEEYKKMEFDPDTPEQYLKEILIKIVDNKLDSKNRSTEKLIDTNPFYESLANKGIIQYGSGGGLFVPQFLRYIKTYVNPELAHYFFGIVFNSKKDYIFNGTSIQENSISAEFQCNWREPIFSLGRYCLLSIDVEKTSFDFGILSRPGRSKNIIEIIKRQLKMATLSLVAKALDGYSSSSNPRGPHTFAMARKNECDDAWFLYDDLNKLVKKVDYDIPQENDVYAARSFTYKNGNDIYTTDLVYLKVDSPKTASPQSIFDCVKNNEFNNIDNPSIKASINTQDGATSFSALHLACIKANRGVIKKLIEMGADINAKTGLGDTPLHIAAIACSSDTIQYLIDKGAQVNTPNRLDRSPLYYAIRDANPFAIDALINAGADINLQLGEIKDYESAQPLFNYFLNKISTQNVLALAPLIEKISLSKKLTLIDKVKVQSFLDNDISPRWKHEAAEKIRIAVNNILTGSSLPTPAEEDRLREIARLEQQARLAEEARKKEAARLKKERLERQAEAARLKAEKLAEKARLEKEKNGVNKKLTDLKDSLEKLKQKLNILKQSLTSLGKELGV